MGPSAHGALVMCMPVKLAWDVISLPENETSCWVYMVLCIPGPLTPSYLFQRTRSMISLTLMVNINMHSPIWEKVQLKWEGVILNWKWMPLLGQVFPGPLLRRKLLAPSEPDAEPLRRSNLHSGTDACSHPHVSFSLYYFLFFPSGENINKPKTHTCTNVNVFSLD